MPTLSAHTSTLNHFIQLFDVNDHYKKGSKAPAASCYDTDAIADDNSSYGLDGVLETRNPCSAASSRLTRLFALTKKRASIYQSEQHHNCILALIDSVIENHGLLSASYAAIAAEYLPILGKLDESELNRGRTWLLHSSPVLGLGSRTSTEFKWVVARHFATGEFKRDDDAQNYYLTKGFKSLQADSSALKTDLAPFLIELTRVIYEEAKAPRQLTIKKVNRLLKCGNETAKYLCRIYNALPNSPLNNH